MLRHILIIVFLLSLPLCLADTYFYAGTSAVAVNDGTTVTYLYHDRLGTDTATHSLPFGEVLADGERFGFTGKEEDNSGLHYFGARYLDTNTGRFVSIDPVEAAYPYQYVHNNPLFYTDPSGREVAFPNMPSLYINPYGIEMTVPNSANKHVIDTFNSLLDSNTFSYEEYDGGRRLSYDISAFEESNPSPEQRAIFTMMTYLIDMKQKLTVDSGIEDQFNGKNNMISLTLGMLAKSGQLSKYYEGGESALISGPVEAHEFGHAYSFYVKGDLSEVSGTNYENVANDILRSRGESVGKRVYYGYDMGYSEFGRTIILYTPKMRDEALNRLEDKFKEGGVLEGVQISDSDTLELFLNIERKNLREEFPNQFKEKYE